MMSDRGFTPQHRAVRDTVAAYVRRHGIKRGIPLAAAAVGIGERAARHAHEGTHFAADDERAERARIARLQLLENDIRALRAERARVQQELGLRGFSQLGRGQAFGCGGVGQ